MSFSSLSEMSGGKRSGWARRSAAPCRDRAGIIVSRRLEADGVTLLDRIHNIGGGAREEDALLDWPITGRYRWSID
jgi:uncharacterized protein YijF (DUF1287 family)